MNRPLTLFNVLLGYIFLQLAWWGYLIVEHAPQKIGMVVGEFSVFFLLLLLGVSRLRKAILKEANLNKQQRNFLLSVTHELQSPLASIKLYLQTLQKRDLGKSQQERFIAHSLVDIERLNDLVGNMLLATKFENKSYSFPKEPLNLSEVVERVTETLQQLFHDKYLFHQSIEPNIQILGDRFALTSAVGNLIENAIKYSAEGNPIDVSLQNKDGRPTLEISDQGVGIDELDKKKIFQKFYRAGSEETRGTKGTGLGLFIVKQVLDNHRAQILVKNNTPRGSIFEVVFT